MKRSEVLDIIAAWAKPEILQDVYANNYTEWADNFLHTLESELGFMRVEMYGEYERTIEEVPYEPEEGWDAWLEEQDRKDQARDFKVVDYVNMFSGKLDVKPSMVIAQEFLEGASFDELAQKHNLTRERIRQFVCKQRRRYQKSLEENSEK